jgi:hypothetical protein
MVMGAGASGLSTASKVLVMLLGRRQKSHPPNEIRSIIQGLPEISRYHPIPPGPEDLGACNVLAVITPGASRRRPSTKTTWEVEKKHVGHHDKTDLVDLHDPLLPAPARASPGRGAAVKGGSLRLFPPASTIGHSSLTSCLLLSFTYSPYKPSLPCLQLRLLPHSDKHPFFAPSSQKAQHSGVETPRGRVQSHLIQPGHQHSEGLGVAPGDSGSCAANRPPEPERAELSGRRPQVSMVCRRFFKTNTHRGLSLHVSCTTQDDDEKRGSAGR